jgi:hypothetical protein
MEIMKRIISLFLLLSVHVSMAEEPAELVKLRATYDNSLRGEFQKVGKLYHKELLQLKKNYMQAENLEAAVTVDAEIKKLRETHGKMVVKIPEAEEKASPLDGVWVCSYPSKGRIYRLLYYIRGNKGMSEKGAELTVKHHNGIVTVEWGSGWWHKMTPSLDDPDVMKGTNPNKTRLTYTRLKW